jgi:glyoxylase-like metal-dependent hydrolase (beta-lactamase superfamily II)
MYFEQFYLGCLAHASIPGFEGEAVVVDPQRDVELYLKAAADHGVTVRAILESHLHADFVRAQGTGGPHGRDDLHGRAGRSDLSACSCE